ncbi:replication initiator protein A (plasmid) [Jeotgalibaca sp. MA1X17-3]|uniref:replication initiator protein A n=1 Tax=Jeotgalibaca sp. MA1X17-3 TaxID=2908211 RepID=UPI001F367E94|nr:replication initiator protein A [Jeotgalibaca sp. MA1X17-3]UJF16782.1 replication initiator protein A [Jeotgalibaca sp. MA1X17-3]
MSSFNFYKADKAYGELYLQFPKVLLYSDTYSHLSDSAKLAYMLFKDRLHYSLKNNWIDEEGNVYFIFTNKELETLFNKSNKTVGNIKKELVQAGLLLQKQNGFNPRTKKNDPNWLYLADLEVNATDIYQLQREAETVDNSGRVPSTPRQTGNRNAGTVGRSGCVEGTPRQKNAEPVDMGGPVETTLNQYLTKRLKDSKDGKESEKADQTDTDLISHAFQPKEENQETEKQVLTDYIKEQELEFLYGTQLIQKMVTFSFNDFDTFQTFINKLEFSHKSVEKEYNLSIPIHQGTEYFEDTQERLLSTFHRAIQHHRFGKVNNIANYLFISFKQVFIDLADGMIAKRQTEKSTSPLFEIDINSFESNEN